jgi:hypothetical protein
LVGSWRLKPQPGQVKGNRRIQPVTLLLVLLEEPGASLQLLFKCFTTIIHIRGDAKPASITRPQLVSKGHSLPPPGLLERLIGPGQGEAAAQGLLERGGVRARELMGEARRTPFGLPP